MAVVQGYISIDEIIREYMADKGEMTLHNYLPYLNLALQSLREFSMTHTSLIKTSALTLAANKTADYPADMLTWSRIGVKVGDRIKVLGQDGSIIYDVDAQGNTSYVDLARSDTFFPASDNTFYGYGYNGAGYFRDDKANKRWVFSSEVTGSDLFIEYTTTGFTAGTATEIPAVAIGMVKRFIDWKMSEKKDGVASTETQLRKKEYISEQHAILKRTDPLTRDKMMDILINKQVDEIGTRRSYNLSDGVFDFAYLW